MYKSKKILNLLDDIFFIYNIKDEKIWANKFFYKKINKRKVKSVKDIYNLIAINHKFKDLINKINMKDLKLCVNNEVYIYKVSCKKVDKNHLLIKLKDKTNIIKKDKEIFKIKYTDPLTKLKNRRYLYDRFNKNISPKSILFIDIKDFKKVNDDYGHLLGDEVLKTIGKRLKKVIKENDFVIRYGGDEFIIVLQKVSKEIVIKKIINRLINTINKEMNIENVNLNINADIGYSRYPFDSVNLDQLIDFADMAMYFAKKESSKNVCGFDHKILSQIKNKKILEFKIKESIIKKDYNIKFKKINFYKSEYQKAYKLKIEFNNIKKLKNINLINDNELKLKIDKILTKESIAKIKNNNRYIFLRISNVGLNSNEYYNFLKKYIERENIDTKYLVLDILKKTLNKNINDRLIKLRNLGIKISISNLEKDEIIFNKTNYDFFNIIHKNNFSTKGNKIYNKKVLKNMNNLFENFDRNIIFSFESNI
ncbi:MAG: diguanylate cyclase domain-containing protein [Bacillota bacterium]